MFVNVMQNKTWFILLNHKSNTIKIIFPSMVDIFQHVAGEKNDSNSNLIIMTFNFFTQLLEMAEK